MRAILGAAVVLALACGTAVAQDKIDGTKLVGKWEMKEKKKGDPEMTMEFTKDGKLIAIVNLGGKELKIDGTYKLDGNKLIMKMKFMEKEMEETVTISKLTDDEMTGAGKDGKADTFVKIKPKPEK